MTTGSSSPDILRGEVSRQLLTEDASWIVDMCTPNTAVMDSLRSTLVLLHLPYLTRIAYEGAVALHSRNANMGLPKLAACLTSNFATITARMRHLSKLMDDTQKSYSDVLSDFAAVIANQRGQYLGKRMKLGWPWQHDMGLLTVGSSVVGTTMAMALRLGMGTGQSVQDAGTFNVAREWGISLALQMSAGIPPQSPRVDWSTYPIPWTDVLLRRYVATRFESVFPMELKLLLLLILSDLNVSLTVMERACTMHEMPVFRARTVTLFHALTTLRRVVDNYQGLKSRSMTECRMLLASAPVVRLLSREGKNVRNRCMHYEITDQRISPTIGMPMFGLVEAVFPGSTWGDFNADVVAVAKSFVGILQCWYS